jgi:hypothetical protein
MMGLGGRSPRGKQLLFPTLQSPLLLALYLSYHLGKRPPHQHQSHLYLSHCPVRMRALRSHLKLLQSVRLAVHLQET